MQIIVRKVYHLLAMGLFVPVFFWDLQLLALSLAIAFAALVLLEVLRCMRLPLLGQAVQDFMQVGVWVCVFVYVCVLSQQDEEHLGRGIRSRWNSSMLAAGPGGMSSRQ